MKRYFSFIIFFPQWKAKQSKAKPKPTTCYIVDNVWWVNFMTSRFIYRIKIWIITMTCVHTNIIRVNYNDYAPPKKNCITTQWIFISSWCCPLMWQSRWHLRWFIVPAWLFRIFIFAVCVKLLTVKLHRNAKFYRFVYTRDSGCGRLWEHVFFLLNKINDINMCDVIYNNK